MGGGGGTFKTYVTELLVMGGKKIWNIEAL